MSDSDRRDFFDEHARLAGRLSKEQFDAIGEIMRVALGTPPSPDRLSRTLSALRDAVSDLADEGLDPFFIVYAIGNYTPSEPDRWPDEWEADVRNSFAALNRGYGYLVRELVRIDLTGPRDWAFASVRGLTVTGPGGDTRRTRLAITRNDEVSFELEGPPEAMVRLATLILRDLTPLPSEFWEDLDGDEIDRLKHAINGFVEATVVSQEQQASGEQSTRAE